MADPYIDQYETQGYGAFAARQLREMLLGRNKAYDAAIEFNARAIEEATAAMGVELKRVESHTVTTYAGDESATVQAARDTLRRLYRYAQSRENGDALASSLLQDTPLTVVGKTRPTRLAALVMHALKVVGDSADSLPEHAQWKKELRAASEALDALNTEVRRSRAERREMTPDVAKARDAWLKTYGAAKSCAESLLKHLGRTDMMPDLFDDLAEVHQVAGVTDDPPSPDPKDP